MSSLSSEKSCGNEGTGVAMTILQTGRIKSWCKIDGRMVSVWDSHRVTLKYISLLDWSTSLGWLELTCWLVSNSYVPFLSGVHTWTERGGHRLTDLLRLPGISVSTRDVQQSGRQDGRSGTVSIM